MRRLSTISLSGLARWGALGLGLTALVHFGQESQKTSATEAGDADTCAVILDEQESDTPLDGQIRDVQQKIRKTGPGTAQLDRLGWLYVAKARSAQDDDFYLLAGDTADCLSRQVGGRLPALLMEGHVAHSLHRFRRAEEAARILVAERESAFDYGLLGDALLEQGRLEEAQSAYQRMLDLKPGLQAYGRASHLRWLKGAPEEATRLMRLAAQAGGPRISEPTAWCYTRLALLELQTENAAASLLSTEKALQLEPGYAAARFARARALLAAEREEDALAAIDSLASHEPLPEQRWLMADLFRVNGKAERAEDLEDYLRQRGPMEDPRTVSLYLATKGESPDLAVELARAELKVRQDVLTYDALAWALLSAGQVEEADRAMQEALAAGTVDARLFLHAGAVAASAGRLDEAREMLAKANRIRQTLFPSEQGRLDEARLRLGAEVSREHGTDRREGAGTHSRIRRTYYETKD